MFIEIFGEQLLNIMASNGNYDRDAENLYKRWEDYFVIQKRLLLKMEK